MDEHEDDDAIAESSRSTPQNRLLLQFMDEQRRMGVQADAVIRLGAMLMGAGTGGYRVIKAMNRAACALGIDSMDAVVSLNDITCTFHRGDQFRTVVVNRNNPAVDASRIEALENLSRSLEGTYTAQDLHRDLDFIEKRVHRRWSRWIQALAAGVACASFAVLNQYPFSEAILVALAAGFGQTVRHTCAVRQLNQLGTTAVAAAVACLVYFGISKVLMAVNIIHSPTFTAGYVAAVLFLIPGFPLFSSLLDLSRFDLTAGMSRLAYATMVIGTATMSVAAVSLVTGLQPMPPEPSQPAPVWFAAATVATAVGVGGFAILFNSTRKMVLVAAGIGVVGNLARLGLVEAGMQKHFAAFIGALLIGVTGAVLVKRLRLPRITITVPASVIMIPGLLMYQTVYYLNNSEINNAVATAAAASLSVISIGAGLIAARMLTDRAWTFGKRV